MNWDRSEVVGPCFRSQVPWILHALISTILTVIINQLLATGVWISIEFYSVQFSLVSQSHLTLCDSMDCSTPGLPVHHQLQEFTQTHVHWVRDAIQPSYPLSSPSPTAWALKNWCFWTVVLEKTLESPLDCKEIQPVHSEGDQPWDFFGRTDAKAETPVLWPPHASWVKELTHWRRLWCWEGLGARGEGDDRGWDGWMASLTRWTWVWVNSGSWCWTGRPGVLRFMGSQRVGHDWATDLIWSDLILQSDSLRRERVRDKNK